MTTVPRRALSLALIATFSLAGLAHAELKVGDAAPNFKATATTGTVHLSQLLEKGPVVLALYYADFTSG